MNSWLFGKLFGIMVQRKRISLADAKRTHLTYLTPITKPITDYSNLIEIFYHSRTLS